VISLNFSCTGLHSLGHHAACYSEQVTAGWAIPLLLEMLDRPVDDLPFMLSASAACLCILAANPDSKITIAKVKSVFDIRRA
jgi:hypothetical protein